MTILTNKQSIGLPENYEELKKSAGRKSDWRERLDAVEELGQSKNTQTIDILVRLMNDDAVYKVQEAAYRQLKGLGLTDGIKAPTRKQGDLIKGTSKTLLRIKKSLPKDHSYNDFKEKLKNMRLDIYDTYEGEKGADFDKWLESTWESLNKK
ncbi:HEAT repeat domain-containing protein [Peribacillus psychrosaccharolyticus]|uniref:HEAT repeat domain-containing protein n=1 Tax=Peribacillus psychrosaccharolyticus TaxID=1407 RepID=UPI003D2D38C4